MGWPTGSKWLLHSPKHLRINSQKPEIRTAYPNWDVNTIQGSPTAIISIRNSQRNIVGRCVFASILVLYPNSVLITAVPKNVRPPSAIRSTIWASAVSSVTLARNILKCVCSLSNGSSWISAIERIKTAKVDTEVSVQTAVCCDTDNLAKSIATRFAVIISMHWILDVGRTKK